MITNRPWWVRHRQVLEEEELALRDLADGGHITLNDEMLVNHQVRQYALVHTCKGTTLDLSVTFSDQHPYFQPAVFAAQRTGVHQNPFNGQLCLLEGGTWHWDQSQTVGAMIREQLPRILDDRPSPSGDRGTLAPLHTGHVHPYAKYFPSAERTAVRVGDTTAALAGADSGTMVVVLDAAGLPEVLRGTVAEIRDSRNRLLWSELGAIVEPLPRDAHPRIRVPWVRLAELPRANTAEAVLEAIDAAGPALVPRPEWAGAGADISVVAAVIEDGIKPFESGDAWLFVVRSFTPAARTAAREQPAVAPYLAEAFRSDRRSMTERVPSLAPLSKKQVVLFGVGGIGAPLAIELAKAGTGLLVILDKDTVEPGIAARWPLGFQAAGEDKTSGLANFIRQHWPHTTVVEISGGLGRPRVVGGGDPQWKCVDSYLRIADLVVDATAEVGVTYYLSDLTRAWGRPLLIASTTEGGWGGRVIHLGADHDAPCWYCIEAHTEDGTLPTPPSDPDPARGSVHPAGCAETTFTAAGFDVAAVSLSAMRLAASVLTSRAEGGYPPVDWNVAIHSFRNAATAFPGSAEPFLVTRHADCASCKSRDSSARARRPDAVAGTRRATR